MSDKTGIEWADATWNPVTGCTKVSPGCDHCYAETLAERFRGTPGHYYETGFDVQLRPDKLDLPLRWRKPRRIFVNSMSDLFHDDIPDAYIGTVFHVMAKAEQHTFQLLTKRHARMRSLLNRWATEGIETDLGYLHNGKPLGRVRHTRPLWTPPPNVWLGVSVETQQWADIRIPALLDTPAAVRFLSCEPLLGHVDLTQGKEGIAESFVEVLDWVIVGGESGRDARPMHPDWARSLRDQCVAAAVPVLFKQWGEWAIDFTRGTHLLQTTGQLITRESGTTKDPYGHGSGTLDLVDRGHPGWVRVRRAGKKAAGRELDGRTWDQYPPQTPSGGADEPARALVVDAPTPSDGHHQERP